MRKVVSNSLLRLRKRLHTHSFEPDAEAKCEQFLQQAIQFDPTDPEVYSTMASVRLSQEREEDAVQALDKAFNTWRAAEPGPLLQSPLSERIELKLTPGHPSIPPFASRTALAKLFIETCQYLSALEILTVLEYEDDEDIQVQYLLGIVWYCLAEQRYHGTSPPGGDGLGLSETAEECGIEARDYFENCLKVRLTL